MMKANGVLVRMLAKSVTEGLIRMDDAVIILLNEQAIEDTAYKLIDRVRTQR